MRSQKNMIDVKNCTVISKIKSGGFGSIFLIKNKETNEEFAAKIIKADDNDEQNKKMINREIGIMMRIQHPTIIQFYGYSLKDFEGHNNVAIIMNYAKNGSLATLLQNITKGLLEKYIDNTHRQKILIGIARGMMYLHQNRIIHRDLKPDNILLDENLLPLITDFGLSKIYESGSSRNQSQSYGTSIYMAPEVIRGECYNGKADVFSFAILMFEVVTDTTPYPDFQSGKMSLFQFNNKVALENLRPKFTVPIKESLKNLIEQCWSADPSERPTFEEIFNKLAFNLEESVYDVFQNNEYKYYLDDVDVDEILSYAYDIHENNININNSNYNKQIEKKVIENDGVISGLINDNKKLHIENEEIKNQYKNLSELVNKLVNDNKKLQKENEETKCQLKKLSEQIKKITIDNESLLDDNQNSAYIQKGIIIPFKSNKLDGIINYLKKKYQEKIFEIIDVTVSQNYDPSNNLPANVIVYDNLQKYVYVDGVPNAWVCVDFKKHRIIPFHYTVGTSGSGSFLKTWVIEASNNNISWDKLDEQVNCTATNGSYIVHSFPITIIKKTGYRFVRMRHTDNNWGGSGFLDLSILEFHGTLI